MLLSKIQSIDELLKIASDFFDASNLELTNKVNGKIRKQLSRAIEPFVTSAATDNKHFDAIPFEEMKQALEELGYTILQEDNTPWAGMLLGSEGNEYFTLGVKRRMEGRYEPVENAMLALSWYQRPSGRYEITAYIT